MYKWIRHKYFGVTHTTTAQHCNDGPWYAWGNHGSDHKYGGLYEVSGGGGARVLTGAGYGSSFLGSWDAVTAKVSPVGGYADLSVGDTVCTQGANSGNHCGLEVDNLSVYRNSFTGYSCAPGSTDCLEEIQAKNANGGAAVARGDSGGPVITYGSDGIHIRAAGMIQSGNGTQFTCSEKLVSYSSGDCFPKVNFTSMRFIVSTIDGASLVTN